MSVVAPGSYLIATIASGKGTLAGKFYETYNANGFATDTRLTAAFTAAPPGSALRRSRGPRATGFGGPRR